MQNTTFVRRRPRSHTYTYFFEQIVMALLTSLAVFLLVLLTAVFGSQLWYAGRIFPGVSVYGVNVGSMSVKDAAAKINQNLTYPLSGKILLRDGQQSWSVAPGEIGLFLDSQKSAQKAYDLGRSGGLFTRLTDQLNAWYRGEEVAPVLIFDSRLAFDYLSSLAAQVDRPLVEASLEIVNNTVAAHPGQTGRQVDVAATLDKLVQQTSLIQDGVVPLVIRETRPEVLDITNQAEYARRVLNQPLTLSLPEGQTSKKGPWVIEQTMLANMLQIKRVKSQTQTDLQVELSAENLRTYLTSLSGSLNLSPQNARFTFNDETKKVEVIEKAVNGRTLDIEKTITSIQQKLGHDEHNIPLEFVYTQPAITDSFDAPKMGIKELIHSQTSYFYGSSPERVQNIQAAASRFHGVLVAPGEVFSMAQTMGDVSLDNGYAEALIIYGDQTIKGVGGGVCQVSTTLFRAAFFAGFPIAERHAHAYRVYYYEKASGNRLNPKLAGLDATVFVPLVDFKFTNDSPYWLLMETYVDTSNSSITWKFYSTKDGRSVDWETSGPTNVTPPPETLYRENPDLPNGTIHQVDWAAEGADITVNRTVTKDGAVYIQDTFKTHYEPWRAIFEYGPGTEIPTNQ
jgi:vancomycin resistance protein YoaR